MRNVVLGAIGVLWGGGMINLGPRQRGLVRERCVRRRLADGIRLRGCAPGGRKLDADQAVPEKLTSRHGSLSITLNRFQCVPVSAALRSRALGAGAGRARSWCAARGFRTWSSAPCEPRVNEPQRGRAPLAPRVADGRSRGSSTGGSRLSPLVEFEIRSDDTTAALADFFHLRMRTSTCSSAPDALSRPR